MSENNENNGNVVIFEAFKNAKQWEDDYPQFLGKVEQCFGAKTDPESMCKRLYYAVRFLEGVVNSYLIFSILGVNLNDESNKRGRKYLIEWLEEILKNLKEGEV